MSKYASSNNGSSHQHQTLKLSAKEMQEYQEAFSFFDLDKDGFIQTSEIGKVMRSGGLNPSESELDNLIRISSSSRTNKIDFAEFMHLIAKNIGENRVDESQIRESFKIFDSYGNGLVNLMQMRVSLQNLGEKLRDEEIDELIREADIDTEGNVNYEELVKILCKN